MIVDANPRAVLPGEGGVLEVVNALQMLDYKFHTSQQLDKPVNDAAKNRLFFSDEALYAAAPELAPPQSTPRKKTPLNQAASQPPMPEPAPSPPPPKRNLIEAMTAAMNAPAKPPAKRAVKLHAYRAEGFSRDNPDIAVFMIVDVEHRYDAAQVAEKIARPEYCFNGAAIPIDGRAVPDVARNRLFFSNAEFTAVPLGVAQTPTAPTPKSPSKPAPTPLKSIVPSKENAPVTVTEAEFSGLQRAFEHFNTELFDGTLPNLAIRLQCKANSAGHYGPNRLTYRVDGSSENELSLNPDCFVDESDEQACQTLVHEMCHHWQKFFGTYPSKGYHDKQWAAKMKAIGLQPSSTGKPGGRETGSKMSDYIIAGGPFTRRSPSSRPPDGCSLRNRRVVPPPRSATRFQDQVLLSELRSERLGQA